MKKAPATNVASKTSHEPGIVFRAPSELRPWPGNPRTHGDRQLTALKAAIRKFGFTAPVLVDPAGFILSGHGRVQAARDLSLASIPTRVIDGLSESAKRAYVIADNKLALLSDWDKAQLKAELEILMHTEFDIETTGFSTAEIDLMLDGQSEPDKADSDDLQESDVRPDVISQEGDLWLLGGHRLLCADALSPASFEAVMQGELAQMIVTDPPYNVPIEGHVCGTGKIKHAEFAMASGEMSSKEFTAFLNRALSNIHAHSQNGSIVYAFMDWRHTREIQDAAEPLFGPPKQLCVWVKDNAGLGSFYRSRHELVFVFKKGSAKHVNNFQLGEHGRYRTNVWTYPGVNTFTGKGFELLKHHPTVKPTGLIADALRDCSRRNGLVLDPFAGSGTVLVAAERTGRRARAIEIDPQYVDVAINRWQRVTGKQAVLAANGKTWDQVQTERAPDETVEV